MEEAAIGSSKTRPLAEGVGGTRGLCGGLRVASAGGRCAVAVWPLRTPWSIAVPVGTPHDCSSG